MNILLIITPFLPAQTPNTIRWSAVVKNLISNGYKVCVLSSEWTGSKNVDYVDGIKVYRSGHNTLLDLVYTKLGISKRRNTFGKPSNRRPSLLSRVLEFLVNKFWRNYYWPDGSVLFYRKARKKVFDIIKDEKITHVVSVGLPFSSHLLAKVVKEKLPNIKWLMDVQDPFSISDQFWVNNFSKYALKNISEESNCLKLSDSVVFTNQIVTQLYAELFASESHKFKVIPPLFNVPKLADLKSSSSGDTKIQIAYFGSFYEGVRSPFRFLQLIDTLYKNDKASIGKLHFHFYGEMNKFSKPIFLMFNHLSDFITHHGLIAHEQILTHVSQYDILLNFGNSTNYHLPSKVVELLFYNKPIVNVISINDDSTKAFLKDKVEVLNLKIGKDRLEEHADEFIRFVLKARRKSEFNFDAIQPYEVESITALYLKALNE